ncbi:MAG: molybdopterin-binding protein, partial [Cyclobacteriaceae bacterium]|nr:molybdopterin-binding protein [Cyclobacteriaceae bacterium]
MKKVKVDIITIGDEILYGQILDTNSKWLSEKLDENGFKVERSITIGDNKQDILQTLQSSWADSSLVIITGGLGPTPDDLTKACLAEFFNCQL